jgi:hypothetical protein
VEFFRVNYSPMTRMLELRPYLRSQIVAIKLTRRWSRRQEAERDYTEPALLKLFKSRLDV